jgi:pimeloyl-ACP methyl ester carboxylesterase
MAISGGGPYAAHVAATAPSRVRSLHLACAFSEWLDSSRVPPLDEIAADPATWWRYPRSSPVHAIPGFAESAVEEATVARFALGRDVPHDGLAKAFALYESEPLPDLSRVEAPALLYWGSDDEMVPVAHLERWRGALTNVARIRVYEGEGHDIQYRHWDQILADVVHLGDRVVVSKDGTTLLVDEAEAELLLLGGATLGLAAWASVNPAEAALPRARADLP